MAHYIPFVATHLATFVLCRCKAFAGVSARPDMAESRREMAIRYVEQGRRIVEDQRDGRKVQSRSRQPRRSAAARLIFQTRFVMTVTLASGRAR
jgi:hypothetical protein